MRYLANTLVLLGWFMVIGQAAYAIEITAGDTQLIIPAPEGYSPITQTMQPFADWAKQNVPPQNDQLALFLADAEAAAAARGEMPQPKRTFRVEASKRLLALSITPAHFRELKEMMTSQNKQVQEEIRARVPDVLDKINKGVAEKYGPGMDVLLDQMIPLPPHAETPNSFAYSSVVTMRCADAEGKPFLLETASTLTVMLIKGKVVGFYVDGAKADLEWTRGEARKWTEAVTAANTAPGGAAVRTPTTLPADRRQNNAAGEAARN